MRNEGKETCDLCDQPATPGSRNPKFDTLCPGCEDSPLRQDGAMYGPTPTPTRPPAHGNTTR